MILKMNSVVQNNEKYNKIAQSQDILHISDTALVIPESLSETFFKML